MNITRSLLVLTVLSELAGCTSLASRVSYSADQTNPASPPTGGFAFGLRETTVILSGSAPSSKSQASTPAAANGGSAAPAARPPKAKPPGSNPSDAANPGAPSGTATPPPAKSPDSSPQAASNSTIYTVKTEICGSLAASDWRKCLAQASLSSASITNASLPAYVVKPEKKEFTRTTLTPKVDTSDPLLLSSVTFNTTSTASARITQAGTDAVAGLAFGPWGAAAGGLIGLLLPTPPPTGGAEANAPPPPITDLVCEKDRRKVRAPDPQQPPALHLMLPITLDVDAIPDGSASAPNCWNVMPTADDDLPNPSPAQWFYRVLEDKKPKQPATKVPPIITDDTLIPTLKDPDGSRIFQARSDYFASTGWSAATDTFPVSACRTALLQITHIEELVNKTDVNGVAAKEYPLVVADSSYVQVVHAPTQGSVTVLPLCGGYASAGPPGTPFTDSMNALLQAVQKIKSGQSKSK